MTEEQLRAMATALQAAGARMVRISRRDRVGDPVSPQRLSVLSALSSVGPMSLAELAALQEVKAPTMSRIVDGLVKNGLATREADPANRRKVRIAPTEEGRLRLEAGRDGRVRALRERLGRLAESEQRALARGVEVLERVLR